jgi:hypothetical protein
VDRLSSIDLSASSISSAVNSIHTIDIAHPPLPVAEAEVMLDDTLRTFSLSSQQRVLKIIHGYGSGGKGGSLKTLVRNWAFVNRNRFKEIIDGENLSPFNPIVQQLLSAVEVNLSDIGSPNEGVTIVWIR